MDKQIVKSIYWSVALCLSGSISRTWGPESWWNEPGRSTVSLGQRRSLSPGYWPHHEHHQWPSLPGKHPPGYCTAGRWKHHHPGQLIQSLRETKGTYLNVFKMHLFNLLLLLEGVKRVLISLPVIRLSRWSSTVWSGKRTHCAMNRCFHY